MAYINTSRGKLEYKERIVFCGIKQIDKDISFENLKCVNDVLLRNGVRYGLMYGTLLGAVREHDFITWDEDIDLFVLSEDEEKLKDSIWDLQEKGFLLFRYDRTGIYSISRNGEYIDFYIFGIYSDGIRSAGCNRKFFPDELLSNTVMYDFKGVKFPIPKDYSKLLEVEYGPHWDIPVQYMNYDMSWIEKLQQRLKFYFRRNLPDFIYIPIAKFKHRHNKKIFTEKFRNIGFPHLVIK